MKKNYRPRIAFLTLLYFILLVWIISFKCNLPTPVSDCLTIFPPMSIAERIRAGLHFSYQSLLSRDAILNALVFLPLGILLPILFARDGFFRYLIVAVCLTGIFEGVQLFTCVGQWTAIDLVANTLGYVIGYLIYRLLVKYLPSRFVGRVALVIILIATPVAVFAIYQTVANFQMYLR